MRWTLSRVVTSEKAHEVSVFVTTASYGLSLKAFQVNWINRTDTQNTEMKLTEYRVNRTGTGNLEALVSSSVSQEIEVYQDTCSMFF